jgi:hypothetical protein
VPDSDTTLATRTPFTPVTDNALASTLQEQLLDRIPGAFCAVLASSDGFLIAHVGVPGTDPVTTADTLAALSTTRAAVGHGLSAAFGDPADHDTARWGQGLDYFPGTGWVVTRRGANNNVLTVGCGVNANLTTVGTVVEQLFRHLDAQLGVAERDQSIPAARG